MKGEIPEKIMECIRNAYRNIDREILQPGHESFIKPAAKFIEGDGHQFEHSFIVIPLLQQTVKIISKNFYFKRFLLKYAVFQLFACLMLNEMYNVTFLC